MNKFYELIEEICAKDSRYKPDAYEFIMQGLKFTQDRLKRKAHVSGRELSVGLKDYAVMQYGPMAKIVLGYWGIAETRDFGNIVFNLIENKLLSRSEEDSPADFVGVYDFDSAFVNVLRDSVIEEIKYGRQGR